MSLTIFISLLACLTFTAQAATTLILVVGAGGEEEFGTQFRAWAQQWENAGRKAGAKVHLLQPGAAQEAADAFIQKAASEAGVASAKSSGGSEQRDRLQKLLADEPKKSAEELWLVLLGHGTFDGKEAKFNLRGDDVSAPELAAWLKPFERPLAVVNCSAASGPFLKALSGPQRAVITATRSGGEENFAHFGEFLAGAVADPAADLDKDGQTSLLEAFLAAGRRTVEFYEKEGRLATEHALLDDNGDGLGTQADWFRGIRAVKKAADGAALDGLRAHQFHLVRNEAEQKLPPAVRARRDELEMAVAKLRDTKSTMSEDDYYAKLEPLLLEIARLYEGK